MSETIFWGDHSESYLASFQKSQGKTNNCGVYAASAAISLLRDGQLIDYDEATSITDAHTAISLAGLARLIVRKNLRLWPNGPTTPKQQANLAEHIGRRYGLSITAQVQKGTPESLLACLQEPDKLALITIGWNDKSRPLIIDPTGKLLRFAPVGELCLFNVTFRAPFGAHVMLLAAYDPARKFKFRGGKKMTAPWGFINSWMDGADTNAPGHGYLYWMPDEDFQSAWAYNIWAGRNKMVTITKRRPS